MKRTLSLLLCVVMVASAFGLGTFTAAAENEEGTIYYYETDFVNTYKDFIDFVADKIANFETKVTVSEFNSLYNTNLQLQVSKQQILFDTLVYTHPEYFWFKSLSSSYYSSTGNIASVTLYYYNDAETTEAQKVKFDEKVDWYLSKLDSSMSDFEKALTLHDALCVNNAYELYDADGNNTDVYDLMVDGIGKCYCYSGAYAYLLKRAGINSDQVLSDDSVENYMNHQWNKVQLDGDWYNVDVTWDDPVVNKSSSDSSSCDVLASAQHKYFLFSDDIAGDTSRFGEKGIHHDYFSSVAANSTKYDNYSLHDSNSRLCYVNGELYMVDNTIGKGKIVKYDYITDSSTEVVDISGKYWSAGEGRSWRGCYVTMDSQDGYIYYNTPSAVYVYDTVEGTNDMFWNNTEENEIYGTLIVDGRVYAAVTESPNYARTAVLAGDCKTRSTPYVTKDGVELSLTAEFTRDSEDTTPFGISNTFKNFQILGVQKKAEADDNARSVRFISVLKDEILQDAADYGFIAVGSDSMEAARNIVTSLSLDTVPEKNVFSCKDFDNEVSGEYGVSNSDKSYKYVTLGVDNIGDSGVAVMFYLKDTNGSVFYAPYVDSVGEIFNNCAVDWATLINQ